MIDAEGDALAIWCTLVSRRPDIALRRGAVVKTSLRRARTGIWSEPVDLPSTGAVSPRLAGSLSGDAIAVWVERRGETSFVRADTLLHSRDGTDRR